MKRKPTTPKRTGEALRLIAVARDRSDLDYVGEALSQDGLEWGAGGSRICGYEIYVSKPAEGRKCITSTHRWRTGDLNVFFLTHPPRFSKEVHADDAAEFKAWAESLARRRSEFGT